MDKEILKPFDLSGTFGVNNVHPDAPRNERPDFILLDKSCTIGAQGILSMIAVFEHS